MFDYQLPEPLTVAGLSDAALVDAMAECAAAETAAAGRRLVVIAEFAARRLGGEHAGWATDDWDAASVEIGAALGMSMGRASSQMDLALKLRTRLPRLAALLCDGKVTLQVARTAAARTDLIVDRDAVARVLGGRMPIA